MNSVGQELRPYLRRARLQLALIAFLSALSLAAPTALLALWIFRALSFSKALEGAMAVAFIAGMIVIIRRLPLPTKVQVALSCDSHLSGKESVTTALHLEAEDSTNPFVERVNEVAKDTLEKGRPGDVFPMPPIRKFIVVLSLWILAFFLSAYSPFSYGPPVRQKTGVDKAKAAHEAKRLLEAAKTIEKHSSQSKEMKALADRLRKEASDLNKVALSPHSSLKETMKSLSRLGEEVEAKSRKSGNQGVSVGAALSALAQCKETTSLAKALQTGNEEQMKEALEKIDGSRRRSCGRCCSSHSRCSR